MMKAKERSVGALDRTGHGCVLVGPVPPVRPGTVLVEVHASLISPGTELSGARRARLEPGPAEQAPTPFGYQNAGVVREAGDGVASLQPGDRVACMGAGYALHSEYAVVPQNLCARLPAQVSFAAGAFAHLAATALHAVRRGAPGLGEHTLVVGLGLVGQLAARFAQMAGSFVMGWDRIGFRCDTARAWGIDATAMAGVDELAECARDFTNGHGFDMAVLAFGDDGTAALETVRDVMKVSPDGHAMGRLCMVGGLTTRQPWGAGMGNLDVLSCARTGPGYHDEAWEHGDVGYPPVFMRWHTRSHLELVLRWMASGRLDVTSLVTHRVPLARIDEAVSAHIERQDATLGTVLLMRPDD